jgi:hypothetical protein
VGAGTQPIVAAPVQAATAGARRRTEVAHRELGLEHLRAGNLDPEGARPGPRRDHLGQLGALEVQRRALARDEPGRMSSPQTSW